MKDQYTRKEKMYATTRINVHSKCTWSTLMKERNDSNDTRRQSENYDDVRKELTYFLMNKQFLIFFYIISFIFKTIIGD